MRSARLTNGAGWIANSKGCDQPIEIYLSHGVHIDHLKATAGARGTCKIVVYEQPWSNLFPAVWSG